MWVSGRFRFLQPLIGFQSFLSHGVGFSWNRIEYNRDDGDDSDHSHGRDRHGYDDADRDLELSGLDG